jgi:hypothetical protein
MFETLREFRPLAICYSFFLFQLICIFYDHLRRINLFLLSTEKKLCFYFNIFFLNKFVRGAGIAQSV